MLLSLLIRPEQNPTVMLTSGKKNPKEASKGQAELPSCPLLHLVQGKRRSGGSQWDHPHCAWFLVMDLADTSSHIKTTGVGVSSPNSVSVEAGLNDCSCCIPLKGAALSSGISRVFSFVGMSTKHPHPNKLIVHYCWRTAALVQHWRAALYSPDHISHLFLTLLEGQMHFQICWWMFHPGLKSPFHRSFPKP